MVPGNLFACGLRIDTEENYYAPRKELIEKTYTQLTGYDPHKGGHYFTVWAPRQTGKTGIMQQMSIKKDPRFHVKFCLSPSFLFRPYITSPILISVCRKCLPHESKFFRLFIG